MNPANDDEDLEFDDAIESSLSQNITIINNQKNLQQLKPEINNNTLFKHLHVNNSSDNEILHDKITNRKFTSAASVVVGAVSAASDSLELSSNGICMPKQPAINSFKAENIARSIDPYLPSKIENTESMSLISSVKLEAPDDLVADEIIIESKMESDLDVVKRNIVIAHETKSTDKLVMDDQMDSERIILGEGNDERTERNPINDDEVISISNNEHIDKSNAAAKNGESLMIYKLSNA